MKKSFTWLISLVVLLGFFSIQASALNDADKVWPEDGTTPAYTKTTDKLMIIYPEAVVASTGSVRLSVDGGALVRVLPATDSRISYAKGDTVEVDFSADLKELTKYSVTVDAGAFKTADDGTALSSESWVFTTGDYTAPVLKSVVPVKGAVVDDQTNYTLVMTFEDASAVVAGAGNVSLYKADGNIWDLIDVTTQGTLSGSVLTLSTLRPLEDNVDYVVTIDAGVVTDDGKRADGEKNPYAGLTDRTEWIFSSKDFTIPGFASGYPKIANIGYTSADVVVKTTEVGTVYAYAVTDGASVPTAATIRANGESVDVTSAGSEFTISLTGLGDAATSADFDIYIIADNQDVLAGDADWVKKDVKTKENTAPLLADVEYKKGTAVSASATVASNVVTTTGAVDQKITQVVLEFNEEVKIGAGSVIFRKVLDNSNYLVVDAASISVDSSDKTLVKVPVTGFENNTQYYVIVSNTLVLDKYDNNYSGISSTAAWRFTTNDIIPPTFTYAPAEGASDVAKNANIVLTFDELVYAQSGFNFSAAFDAVSPASPFRVEVNETSVAFAVTHSTSGGISKITINPTADFPSEAVVVVYIKANSIADVGGNVVDPAGQGIAFVVEDYEGPALTWETLPASPEDNVVLEFNEPVYLLGGGEITDANLSAVLTLKQTNASGANIPYTATIDENRMVITITPDAPWGSEKTYYVAITSDLEDGSGNEFDGTDRTNTFTIADVTPATVDLSSVAGKTISTTATVTMIFKEGSTPEARAKLFYNGAWQTYALTDMDQVIILKEGDENGPDVAITSVTSTDDATFNIVAALQGNKTYYLGIGPSTKGADGNVNVEKFVTFNTKFEGVPTVASLSPADNSKEVAVGANFVITFNTDVEKVAEASWPAGFVFDDGTTLTAVTYSEVTVSGKVVTINPSSNLTANSAYDLIIPAGTFLNKNNTASGNALIDAGAWNFETVDTELDVLTYAPGLGATNVAINAKLVLTFDEAVSIGTGTIDIRNYDTGNRVELIDVTSTQVSLSSDKKTLTITPSALFKYDTQYYVETTEGIVVDWVGNKLGAIFGMDNWEFTTANPDLAIVKTTPADGADKIANNASIVIEFNREIAAGTGEVGYIEWDGTTEQVQSYPIGSTNITIEGKTLTIIHPDKVFPEDTEIFVYLGAGAIEAQTDDTKTNGVLNRTTASGLATGPISFNTGDVNPPVPTFSPAAFNSGNPVYVAVDENIVITFDEDIYNADGSAITNADVTSGGLFTVTSSAGSVDFVGTISGRTVTLDPTSDLDEWTVYTITVVANMIEDENGTTITSAITSDFKTVDATAPVIDAFTLTGGNKKVSLSMVTVNDDNPNKFYYLLREKSDAAAPTVAEIKAANNKTVSGTTVAAFDITGLAASTTYQLFYVADDKFGNTTTVAVKEATTDDTVAPLLVSSDPATGDVDVEVTASGIVVKLTFNEVVAIGSGAVTVRDYATQGLLSTLSETALSAVTGDNKSLNLTIPFADDLAPVKLYVEMAKGVVTDVATSPNDFAGIFGKDALAFTTEDNEAPTVVAGESTTGTVDLDTDINIVFSEEVKAGTGTLVLYKGTTLTAGNAVQVFNASEAVFSGKTATVNPTADLENGQTYTVEVNAGFALDVSSNENPNVTSSAVTFTGSMNEKPVATFSPAGGTTPIAKGDLQSICVDFNGENIYLSVAGYSKPLALLTQAELLGQVSMVDGDGNVIPITQVVKYGASHFDVKIAAASLKHETSYTLTVTGFEDIEGLVMDDAVANYITSDGVPPTITFSPANKAKNVTLGSSLTMTFSEDVYYDVINADENIFVYIDNSNVENFVYLREGSASGTDVDFTATISGRVITIVPVEELDPSTTYYYGLKKAVEDIHGQALTVGATGSYAYFDTEDSVDPEIGEVTSSNFAPLGAGVAANANMWVKFNEEVVVSTGAVVIRREDGTIFQTVSGAGLSIDATDKTKLKIAHENFEPVTNYFVELQASVVVDKSGNPNAAYSNPVDGWLFSTSDTYDMVVTNTSPMGDNTPRTVTLEVSFNKVPVAVAGRYLAVYKEDGTAVYQIASTDLVVVGQKASISGIALDADQAYYARIEGGAFKDASNNVFAGLMDNSWEFSTVDNIAPKLVETTPADDDIAVNPATSFVMTFDRDILAGEGMIAVRYAADGTLFEEVDVANATIEGATLTFNLSSALDVNTAFYVIVPEGAVTNTEVTADAYAGIKNTYTWNFTTADEVIYTIAQVQGAGEASPLVGETIELTGVVTAIADGEGFFMQDANAAWSGIWVAYADAAANLEVGDGVVVTGEVAEVDNVTTIVADEVTVADNELVVEAFEVASPSAVQNEMYESVLVAVMGAGTSGVDTTGMFEIFYELNDSAMVNNWLYAYEADSIVAGNYYNVTGVVNGKLDAYTVEPRMEADIVDVTKSTPAPIIDGEVVEFNIYPNPFNNYINIDNHDKLTRAIVTNIAGQRVLDVEYPDHVISTSNLRSGVYVISLYTEDGMAKSVRIVKR